MKDFADRQPLAAEALAQLFLEARTPNAWSDAPVDEATIRRIYEIARMGPTSANTNPARFVWVLTQEKKAQLAAHAFDRNQPKILAAPVTVIVAYDLGFADKAETFFPHNFAALQALAEDPVWASDTAFRNGTLQGAYLMIAARALGLDCGPLSGFNNATLDAEFFAGTRLKSNFLCSMGYGVDTNLFGRLPRLSFDEANSFI